MCSFILWRSVAASLHCQMRFILRPVFLTLFSQLGNSLAQNCGPKIHRELASRSFTDALLRLAADRVCQYPIEAAQVNASYN